MTIKRVQKAASLRGIRFDGHKKWRNNVVGIGYEANYPCGDFCQSDTLEGIYKFVMKYPKV